MDKLTFAPNPVQADIDHVAKHLREDDLREVIAATGSTDIVTVLTDGTYRSTRSWVARAGTQPVALFGVGNVLPKHPGLIGAPWMLLTKDALRAPRADRALVKQGRWYIREMLKDYSHLQNYVDARNTRAIDWLRHLGFKVHAAAPYGPFGLPFHCFDMEA